VYPTEMVRFFSLARLAAALLRRRARRRASEVRFSALLDDIAACCWLGRVAASLGLVHLAPLLNIKYCQHFCVPGKAGNTQFQLALRRALAVQRSSLEDLLLTASLVHAARSPKLFRSPGDRARTHYAEVVIIRS
jgi:hypothetical protein